MPVFPHYIADFFLKICSVLTRTVEETFLLTGMIGWGISIFGVLLSWELMNRILLSMERKLLLLIRKYNTGSVWQRAPRLRRFARGCCPNVPHGFSNGSA